MPGDNILLILGGTFDPVHQGHLRLASELLILVPQAEIRLMPTGQPWHRSFPQASAEQRLEMLQLAVADSFDDNQTIKVDDYEVNKKSASYTVETLQHLRQSMPERSIVWVLGMDAYEGLGSWHRISELADLCHLLVVNRPGNHRHENHHRFGFTPVASIDLLATKTAGFELQLELPMLEISSTSIRQRVSSNNSIRRLVPGAVKEYIKNNELYQKKG